MSVAVSIYLVLSLNGFSRWEIDIDAVYLDGTKVADSKELPSGDLNATRVSALLDTVSW